MLQNAPWTLSCGYSIEKGRGGEMSKLEIEKLMRLAKQVFFFRVVSQLLLSMIVAVT